MLDPSVIGSPRRDRRPRPLLRTTLGGVLRRTRCAQRRTLADVARAAKVSMPYLSEVERGRKEASSEVLAAICDALRIDLADLLALAGRDLAGRRAPAVRPDLIRRDAAQPDPVRPEAGRPEVGRPLIAPPDTVRPNAALPDAALPDAALPDAALPDAALPDAALPDAVALDTAVAQAVLPGVIRLEAARARRGAPPVRGPGDAWCQLAA